MAVITFKPKQITKKLLGALPERGHDVLSRRFGLGADGNCMTLEAIGDMHGVTRERVRQIENAALGAIRRSSVFADEERTFVELRDVLTSLGGVVREDDLLAYFSKDQSIQNSIVFLLVLGNEFKRQKEDARFKHRWLVDEVVADTVHKALDNLYKNLSYDEVITEGEIVTSFLNHLKDVSEQYKNEEIIKRWLSLSKLIGKNRLGEWGIADSPNINVRGMRDYAYLAIRKHGSPMHFTEVAKAITDLFDRRAHVATCHNELIKDSRFVLVGRGLYALTDWGYEGGVVKDVIKNVLRKHGALTKEEIIEKVLKERYVKENTILVNLQDIRHFKKDKTGGGYMLRS